MKKSERIAELECQVESMKKHIGNLESACGISEAQNETAKKLAANMGVLVIGGKGPTGIPDGLCVREDVLLWGKEPVKSVEVTLSNAKSGYTICSWTSGIYMHERILGWLYGRCRVAVTTASGTCELPCDACGEVRK